MSFLLANRRSPARSTYTQVRSSTAVMRTLTPSSVASKASMSTSSSPRGTSHKRRGPPDRAFDARPGAPCGSREAPLEELTPELPYPAHWVGEALDGNDRRVCCGVDDDLLITVGNALRVDPDHAVVDAALLDHQGPHLGIALEATSVRDLETARSDDVAAQESRDRHPHGPDIGFDV